MKIIYNFNYSDDSTSQQKITIEASIPYKNCCESLLASDELSNKLSNKLYKPLILEENQQQIAPLVENFNYDIQSLYITYYIIFYFVLLIFLYLTYRYLKPV